jgi:hypothetical protein
VNSLGRVTFQERPYSPSEFDIGSLEKRAFSKLEEWMILKKEDYYLALRAGIKDPFFDINGNISTLIVFFTQYIQSKTNPLSREKYLEEKELIKKMLRNVMIYKTYQKRKSVCGLIIEDIPQYMIKELKEKLRLK